MGAYSVRKLGLSVLFALLASVNAIAATADDDARRDAQHRINISGRQRMLTQRIAKAACFAALKPENGENIREMKEARALFSSSMQALTTGSAEMGLVPQRDADVLSVINEAAQLSQEYISAVDDFAAAFPAGPVRETLGKIDELNVPLLISVNDAVNLLESKHNDGHLIRRGLASAINVVGRQRMLSQKMSKEFCLVASGFRPQETRALMLGTIALFISSHDELKSGVVQMNLSEKDAIPVLSQLAEIERRWQDLHKIYSRVAEGGTPSEEDVTTVASTNVPFLIEVNRAVELYEKIDTSRVPAH